MYKQYLRRPVVWLFKVAVVSDTKWTHFLIPLVVLTLYFVSFYWFLYGYGETVNAAFVNKAWKYSLVLVAGLYLAIIIFAKRKKGNKPVTRDSREKLWPGDVFLILLPLTPVVQYILNNQDILSPLDSLCVLAVFTAFAILYIILLPLLLGFVGSMKMLMILGLTFTFTITNMSLLSVRYCWFGIGDFRPQLLLFATVFLVGLALYLVAGRKLLYVVIAVFFIANSTNQLVVSDREEALSSNDNKLVELIGSREPLATPNIYLLCYESYVSNETMLGYGIDNSEHEEYLEALSFTIYPHTYSVGSDTPSTMSRVLNASIEYYGFPRRGVSGDSTVHNLLKRFGYETVGIFTGFYFFQGHASSYDYTFPEASPSPHPSYKVLIKAIFMGEFRYDIRDDDPTIEQFREYKINSLENVTNKPKFVYVHISLPGHSQNSGLCRPNETAIYREGLIAANAEMKQDIETIIQYDPAAIIIVVGDHGPYLTKNCTALGHNYSTSEITRLDIQDRFGTFLAIRWPSEGFTKYDDVTVLQDLFPAIFAYLFQDDKLLEAKVPSMLSEERLYRIGGASVDNGIISGGVNDGEPLFVDKR